MKRLFLLLLLCASSAFAQDLRPSAYLGLPGKITVRGGKILGTSGGVTTIAEQTLTPANSATTYVYIDLSGTPAVATNTTGFPTASYFPICVVTKDANGTITSFTDSRPDSFMAAGGAAAIGTNIKNLGAIGDGKRFVDGVTNAGNNQLTSATATFSASDVGHNIWCNRVPMSSSVSLWLAGYTTVASFVNSSTITYAGTNNGVQSGMYCAIINPADPAIILSAFTACKSTFNTPSSGVSYQAPGCNIYLPAGIYGLSNTLDNLISTGNEQCVGIIGDGPGKTVIIPTPPASFTYTNHSGWVIHDRCSQGRLENFTIDDVSTPRNLGGIPSGAIEFYSSSGQINQVAVVDQCNQNGTTVYGIISDGGTNIVIDHPTVIVQGACLGSTGGLAINGIEGDVYSPFLSNTQQNLKISNQASGANGAGFRVWGGVIDEGSITSVVSSQDVWLNGVTLTGGANCLTVDATSLVYMYGGYCGTFGGNTGSGPTVASGGKLIMTDVSVKGVNAGSYCYNSTAYGGISDLGGNQCTVSGGATVYKSTSTGLQFPLTTDSTTQLGGRQQVAGTIPTFAVTGFGGSPTIAVQTGSTDAAGAAIITAGTTPGNSGTFTLTFSTVSGAYGTNKPVCTFTLIDGTGTWNALAQEPRAVDASTSTTSVLANWADNSIALTQGSTYGFNWSCYGK